jgi:hypothetical protein
MSGGNAVILPARNQSWFLSGPHPGAVSVIGRLIEKHKVAWWIARRVLARLNLYAACNNQNPPRPPVIRHDPRRTRHSDRIQKLKSWSYQHGQFGSIKTRQDRQ